MTCEYLENEAAEPKAVCSVDVRISTGLNILFSDNYLNMTEAILTAKVT